MKIFKDDLEQFSIEHGRVFDAVIGDMWNNRMKDKLPYVYSSDNVTFTDDVRGNGIVLRMDNLSFLKDECLEKLREELGPEKKAKKSR